MRRVKTFLKKYYFPILTEAVILCIIFVLTQQIVSTEKVKVTESISPYESLSLCDEYDGKDPASIIFFRALQSIEYSQGTWADKKNSCYGIGIQLYDTEGNLIAETPQRFLAIEYHSNTSEKNEADPELLFLDSYFSDEDLDELLEFANKHAIAVETMTGYFDNYEFIPMEIVFYDNYKPEDRYTLTSETADPSGRPLQVHYEVGCTDPDTLKETNFSSSKEDLFFIGNIFNTYFFNTRPDIQEKLQKELTKPYTLPYDTGFSPREKDGYYIVLSHSTTTQQKNIIYHIVICVDTTALAWYAALCDTFMVPMWILCQGLGIVLIIVYIRLQKKQQKLDEMRDTFLNAMAHEMKTPAAVIKNSSECIQAGIQPEKHEHYLEMIEKEADHMNQLLNTMLVYTRTREATYKLNLEEHNIVQHARQTLKHYETLIQQKDIDVQWDVKSSTPFRYDKSLMEMVLDNFFSNAIKFCPEHKIIRITIKENEFSIYNDGAIISEENQKRIWEPLFQINTARSVEDNSSSGMGLAISAGILNLHHAVYGVINKLDGVEFYFRF